MHASATKPKTSSVPDSAKASAGKASLNFFSMYLPNTAACGEIALAGVPSEVPEDRTDSISKPSSVSIKSSTPFGRPGSASIVTVSLNWSPSDSISPSSVIAGSFVTLKCFSYR